MKLKKIKELLRQMEEETGIQHDILISKDGSGVLESTEIYNSWPFVDLGSLQLKVEEYIKDRHKLKEEPKPREKFEVGDVVYYAGMKGVIISTKHNGTYEILAEWDKGVRDSFTKEGLYSDDHILPLLLTESEYLESKKEK